MLGRLGFAGRLTAILMLALFALWTLGAGITYVTRVPLVSMPGALPLPHQMAAIVELLETAGTRERATILRASSSDTLSVTLADKPPVLPPDGRRLKAVEWLVKRYVESLGHREVIAAIDPLDPEEWRSGNGPLWRLARRQLRIAVALEGGGYVVFETHGELSRRLFGLPPGFWLGALGALVGIAALLAVWREARPLQELSRAVSRFSADGRPALVVPRGAPELRRLIEAVNSMQERIATLLESRTVLLGAVSHDLKTYITRLRLRAELISDPDQQARVERDLDEMTVLIEDALAVARGRSARADSTAVDVAALLRTVCEDHKGAGLETRGESLVAEGDPVALRRMFANLIDNALRYGTSCRVSVAGSGGYILTVIDDDGPGIPEAERALVFEPFYRLETSRNRRTGGSGLGLAIANGIAEGHGGSIELADAPSGGLRVLVRLPALGPAQRPRP